MKNTKLLAKENIAEGTMLFRFAKPSEFNYQAGQTIDLTLIDPQETDAEGNARTFSIVTAPHEADLAIATRMRDTAFKRVLKNMTEGTGMALDGPFGSFTLHENAARPAVFLSGGIGITPFHSMIRDATERGLANQIVLFYSNRRPEDAAFLRELKSFETRNPNFTLVATMTDMGKSAQAWDGERGYIDSAMLQRHLPAGNAPIFYLAGPPAMVAAMRTILAELGVSNDDIRFEEFAGY